MVAGVQTAASMQMLSTRLACFEASLQAVLQGGRQRVHVFSELTTGLLDMLCRDTALTATVPSDLFVKHGILPDEPH